MGGNMARRLARGGVKVHALNRSFEVAVKLAGEEANVVAYRAPRDMVAGLASSRIVWLMLPAGDATDQAIRDPRGFIKIVVNADTSEILGLTAVAQDAGELAAAGVHLLGKTIAEVADTWAPYLTMAEGIRIAAKAFTTDPSQLSCCA